ncbi:uncharacterized protein [Procambarus clarkii]|uniref:uncharacterized protein n=1 Tax=Procambarus clarkii TaxID=6728 RepID=UPI003743E8BF
MIKCVRLRGVRWRAVRVGGLVLLLLWAWVAFSQHSHNLPPTTLSDRFSRSPNLQVAAPPDVVQVADIGHVNLHPHALPHPLEEPFQIKDQDTKKNPMLDVARAARVDSDNINPRYNAKAVKDKLEEHKPKPFRNKIFFQQKKLDIPGEDYEDYYDDPDYEDVSDDEKQGDEEGKWKGRNRIEDDNNAIEEEDDPGAPKVDVKLEDIGGKALKKKKGKKKHRHPKVNMEAENNDKNLVRVNRQIRVDSGMPGKHNFEAGVQGQMMLENKKVFVVNDAPDLEGDLESIENIMVARRSRVKEVCRKYGLGPNAVPGRPRLKHPPTPNHEVFYIDRPDRLAWCPIYKAASTSWLYNFLRLASLSESYVHNTKEQVSHVARRVWPSLDYENAKQALKVCLKFMIVRHPFERLVSAYRDKLENVNIGKENGVDHFYQKYGKKIVAKYRPAGQGPPPNRYSQDMDDPNLPAPSGIEPTFAEFVKYIIDTDLIHYADDHWMPYYLYCTPCLIDYDVIAKFETLNRDQNYIIEKNHLEKKIKPSWKHLTKGKKTSETVQKYFATITKTELTKLYEKYKPDFELFDYSVDEYLHYVQQS